jgi:putative hydrolase of the HAD superfamily
MSTELKALALDFGGVITRTLFENHDLTEKALGLPSGALTWRGPFAPETDPLWQSMQDGHISERDYWLKRSEEVGRLIGEDWNTMADFVKRARGEHPMEIIRPEALDAVDQAKAGGFKLSVFSNELGLFYGEDFRHKLPFLKQFDVILDATYTNILKPDPQAYHDCAEALGFAPSECLFVDDQARNIAGANAVGMKTVHFDVQAPEESFATALALMGIARQEAIHA